MRIGERTFEEGHTYVMGILNVTPDSFSDGGRFIDADAALFHCEEMLRGGADVIDVGGESTRPGYTMVESARETERVAGVIERIKRELGAIVSADTYKSDVARAALEAGADMINDIWGFKYDPKVAEAVKDANASCCLMHNRREPAYGAFMTDVISDIKESIAMAKKAGIDRDRILVDPGVGFAKTHRQNLEVIRRVGELKELGCDILLGVSRKSVIGNVLGLPVNERLEGTLAVTAFAVLRGCRFVRVHDVKENKRVIEMTEAILNG